MKHKIAIVFVVIAVVLSVIFFRDKDYFTLLLVSIIVLFGLVISLGVLFMKFNYFLVSKTKSDSKKVILSFDDGPDPIHTPKILAVLKKHSIKAIFFVIGEKAENHPEILKQIEQEGHVIGNHTYSHHHLFSMQSGKKVREEIEKCDGVIRSILNHETIYFRPPIGYTNPIIARALKKLNKQAIGWELRSYDSVLVKPEALKERLIRNVKPSQIILLHDNLEQTSSMLDAFIVEAQKNGIIFANKEEHLTIN